MTEHSSVAGLIVTLPALLACIGGCGTSGNSRQKHRPPVQVYEATIRWTSYGIPHILAKDLGSVSFGQGYAFTKKYPCVLAKQIVRVRGEYARYFGPGKDGANVAKDLGYKSLDLIAQAERAYGQMSGEARAVMAGFVAGYNHRLSQQDAESVPVACRGAAWRRPISAHELVAYGIHIAMIGSVARMIHMIGQAQPPSNQKGARRLPGFERSPAEALASNAWAIGAERSANGRGLLVANPHFPWRGPLRFYESHLTVPGKLNAYGANLLGLPLVSIAFNKDLGWSHTFSSSRRFAIYRLTLDKTDATKYRYGSETRAMTSKQVSIQVKQANGLLKTVSRTLYTSHHGPIVAGGFLPWTKQYAYAIRDAASPDNRSIEQYLAMLRATDLTSFKAAMRKYHSTPFVNTIYADRDGNAFYVDGSRVPQLSPFALKMWTMARSSMPAVRIAWQRGVIALDGSMRMFKWRGVVPFELAPQLTRRDFVFNANDSYWMTNPKQPLSNESPFYGEIEKPLSARTRMNLKILTERPTAKFTAAQLERAALSNRALMAEMLRDQVVTRCRKGVVKDKTLAPLCATLAKWDLRLNLDSVGAVLWREFIQTFTPRDYLSGDAFLNKFDPTRPLTTPNTLAPPPAGGKDPVVTKLLAAARILRGIGFDPTKVTLRQLQFVIKNGKRIPVHGGARMEGPTNIVFYRKGLGGSDGKLVNEASGLFTKGYPINYGTSFFMVLSFTDAGPRARAVMTYDQPELFAKKQLRDVLFTEAQIAADPNLKIERLRAPKTSH